MKLLNLNIGMKIDNNSEVVKLLTSDNYDIITLQEVMRKLDDKVYERYNNSNIIKSNLSHKYSFYGPLWCGKYHAKQGNITKDFGGLVEQGNEIISRYPIEKSSNVFFYQNYAIFEDTTNFSRDDHPRAFEDVLLNINGKLLQIINIHGTWNKDKMGNERTIHQVKTLLDSVRNDIPSLIVGDFNLLPNSESISLMNENLINLIDQYHITSTRPIFDAGSDKGNIVCDYIFINDRVKINSFEVIESNVSDHLPLLLDFDI